jgi:DNA-binding response OmpR family regulator
MTLGEEIEALKARVLWLERALGLNDHERWAVLGLSPAQAALFALLMARPVATNEGMAVVLESLGFAGSNDNIKAHLWHLRRKLDALSPELEIETLPGMGYRLTDRVKRYASALVGNSLTLLDTS